ncbi:MAG TPA: class I SAM-dependent methyltransferase [Candidatus Udaeobacter sp.]|jgi:ubiquinone/menaquinone biosynthesis C-methylase UbiE|nr:class I SAM-dependent methyltransferase [Candidatus Udaeobacter sp.]
MSQKLTLEQIKEFWRGQAIQHGQSTTVSWSDHRVIEMEIRALVQRLADGDKVLDVGCANGYSTIQLASQRAIEIRGLDYLPEMIGCARASLQSLSSPISGKVDFGVGSIMAIPEPSSIYDKVISIRVVTNLGEWSNQRIALCECARVLKPGGVLLLSEPTIQGWSKLNDLRREWNLPDIPMPAFNTYLDEQQIIEFMAAELELLELVNFSSTYFVGTRVLKPLLAQLLGGKIDPANPNAEWNRWFSTLPACGDYGTQKLFVFRKR